MADRRAAVPFLILVHPVEEDGQTHSAISAADQSVAAKMMAEWSFGRMNMNTSLKSAADAVLARAVSGTPGVPGVVAVATDAKGNIYEGAAGKRQLDGSVDMTTDSVCAIFSTTKNKLHRYTAKVCDNVIAKRHWYADIGFSARRYDDVALTDKLRRLFIIKAGHR